MPFLPLQKMWERFNLSLQDSDASAFFDLMCLGELLVKTAVLGLASALQNDKERQQYAFLHRLVRAEGIGEWDQVLQQMLTGTAAHLFRCEAQAEFEQLTMRVDAASWQYDVIAALHKTVKILNPKLDRLPDKVDGRRWFGLFAELRNATRGHGAPVVSVLGKLTPPLKQSLQILGESFNLFSRPWAYVHQSLAGKHRFTSLGGNASVFASHDLEGTSLPDGIYCFMGNPVHVPLIYSTPEAIDFFYPNGAFRERQFQCLSYITGTTIEVDASPYLEAPTQLPASETHGLGTLELQGKAFSNLPIPPFNYIRRPGLEQELFDVLTFKERHQIVTVYGRGGIGKTSAALTVLSEIAARGDYAAILWFSARDIDLLPDRPLPVKPGVLTQSDIAKEFVRLTEPSDRSEKGFRPIIAFEKALRDAILGPTLFVFDNFETVQQPLDVFRWLDVNVRSPNKILITTRHHDFKGDYPVEVVSMTREECYELVQRTSVDLGIGSWITKEYRAELFAEADGHPYVIKILLGEAKKAGKRTKVERILAGKDQILDALFERTYARLTPGARRTFLVLSSWGMATPELAVESVLLQTKHERFDVPAALDELVYSSFVTRHPGDGAVLRCVETPLAAAVFGRNKLSVEPLKIEVDADISLLRLLGGSPGEAGNAFVERVFKSVARQLVKGAVRFEDILPLLEFVSLKIPYGWLLLSQMYEEIGSDPGSTQAKATVRRYLEVTTRSAEQMRPWERLAALCERTDDYCGWVDAQASLCELPDVGIQKICNVAIQVLTVVRRQRYQMQPLEVKRKVKYTISRIIAMMAANADQCGASDFSHLAWLNLLADDNEGACKWTARGLSLDPENVHCISLAQRLGMRETRLEAGPGRKYSHGAKSW